MSSITLKKRLYDIRINAADKLTGYLHKYSPEKALKFWYYMHTRKRLNIDNPKTFDEKIQWLKLYWQHPLLIKCADKYGVREYCKEKGLPEILNDLYGVYKNPSEIDWEILPDKFVIKTTNSTDTNIICLDKSSLDKKETEEKLFKWLNQTSEKVISERHYSKMEPKIIIEKFIESKKSAIPIDYKFFCFNGQPLFVSVIDGRTEDSLKENIYRVYFDMNWNRIELDKNGVELKELPSKPDNFENMFKYAKLLSNDFPFVRVDFYEGEEYPIIGEMTFTPSGGIASYLKDEVQILLGDELKLPDEKIINNW